MLIGREAPDFRAVACLPDDSFQELRLSDFRGRKYVVLLFYTADFTFVDASELVAFSNTHREFEKRMAQVIAVSTESQFAHRGWRNTAKASGGIEKVAYPLVSDISKQICMDYDVLGEDHLPYRGVFIIDRGGIVRFEMKNDLPLGRNVEECVRVLDALQHHEATGKVLPANWTKGKPDMTASPEGVAEYLTKYA
mmetsp:Transcript_70266/g.121764  ORF Transcript_70266/g.121764 Transcript_70266/m.121764 type:complete len:195 (+) Transcript_70266:98-682(+)